MSRVVDLLYAALLAAAIVGCWTLAALIVGRTL